MLIEILFSKKFKEYTKCKLNRFQGEKKKKLILNKRFLILLTDDEVDDDLVVSTEDDENEERTLNVDGYKLFVTSFALLILPFSFSFSSFITSTIGDLILNEFVSS